MVGRIVKCALISAVLLLFITVGNGYARHNDRDWSLDGRDWSLDGRDWTFDGREWSQDDRYCQQDDRYCDRNGRYRVSIPEPSTLLLLGSGLVGLIGMRKKFKV